MTIREYIKLSEDAIAAMKAAYPDAAYVEDQSDGTPDSGAVIVVYDRKADKRLKYGYRLVPRGAARMVDAAKGNTAIHTTLRGWNGE